MLQSVSVRTETEPNFDDVVGSKTGFTHVAADAVEIVPASVSARISVECMVEVWWCG